MVTFLAIIGGLTILGFIVTYANGHNNKTTPEVKEQTVTITAKMIDDMVKKARVETEKSRIIFEAASEERKKIVRIVIARFRENPNETDRKLLYDDMLTEQSLVEQGRLPIEHRVYDWDSMDELGMDINSFYNPNRFKENDKIEIKPSIVIPKELGKNKYLNSADDFGIMEEGIVE